MAIERKDTHHGVLHGEATSGTTTHVVKEN